MKLNDKNAVIIFVFFLGNFRIILVKDTYRILEQLRVNALEIYRDKLFMSNHVA